MKTIAITLPDIVPGDARLIIRALESGYSRVHIRKPDASQEQVADIIGQIPLPLRKRISIHYHLDLAVRYGLGGVHLNSRSPEIPYGFKGTVSRSCHSLEEVMVHKTSCDYVFLSPVYDSISKKGYKSRFNKEVLSDAAERGIIDSSVYALGGVTPSRLPEIKAAGFGGAAMLGCVWDEFMTPPVVLAIAGSDCSAGAGIQADIKTISAFGCYAASVITAVTSQNTLGVRDIAAVSPSMIRSQILAVLEDMDVAAVKIGMLRGKDSAEAVSDILKQHQGMPVICDPVMVSTSGTGLMDEECRRYIENEIFPLCTLITPNLHEASALAGSCNEIRTAGQMEKAAADLSAKYGCAVLIKGGHLEGDNMLDILYDGTTHRFTTEKIISSNLHGTGCTLSSAIASYLALHRHNILSDKEMEHRNYPLTDAVQAAKSYIQTAIKNAVMMKIGHGNGPLWHF